MAFQHNRTILRSNVTLRHCLADNGLSVGCVDECGLMGARKAVGVGVCGIGCDKKVGGSDRIGDRDR